MIHWLSAALVLTGAVFVLLAAVGITRMPDFYTRLQVITKASTLGASCLVLAAALQFEGTGTTTRALLVIAFLTLTSPVSAQMLAMAAYTERVPLWEEIVVDELQEQEQLRNPPPEHPPDSGSTEAASGEP